MHFCHHMQDLLSKTDPIPTQEFLSHLPPTPKAAETPRGHRVHAQRPGKGFERTASALLFLVPAGEGYRPDRTLLSSACRRGCFGCCSTALVDLASPISMGKRGRGMSERELQSQRSYALEALLLCDLIQSNKIGRHALR